MWRQGVYKFDLQGNLLWRREIGPVTYTAYAPVLLELADGRLVGGGQEGGPVGAFVAPRAVLFSLCPDGDSLWYRTYRLLTGMNTENYLRGLAATPDGGFVASGFVRVSPPDTGTNDGRVFKTDSAGYLQAGGAPVDVGCRPVGLGVEPPAADATLSVWPNPATGAVRVRLAEAGTVRLLDAMGRVVRETRAAAGQEISWALPELAPGLYVVRAGGHTRRLVVAR